MITKKLIVSVAVTVFLAPVCGHAGGMPDLAPSDLSLDSDCQIVLTLKNTGSAELPDAAFGNPPQGSGVQMYSDDKAWGGIILSGIDREKRLKPPGGTVRHTWFPGTPNLVLTPGVHTVKVQVDTNNAIPESNEQNNILTKQLTCRKALPDLVPTDLSLTPDCQIVLTLKNNGAAPVPDAAFGPPPQSSGVQMYSDNKAWGGIILGGIDPQKQLKQPGGTVKHAWFPGAANLKLTPGVHTVRVEVDNNKAVMESNEQNNILTRQLACRVPVSPKNVAPLKRIDLKR